MDSTQKILIVEDNADTRELFALVLKRAGFDVIEAAEGYQAIESALANLPDLILMDLMLPKLSGDKAIAQIKSDPATKHIPIIGCTAATQGEAIERAIAAGAANILHKPINLKKLAEVVRETLVCENVGCSVSTKPTFFDELHL